MHQLRTIKTKNFKMNAFPPSSLGPRRNARALSYAQGVSELHPKVHRSRAREEFLEWRGSGRGPEIEPVPRSLTFHLSKQQVIKVLVSTVTCRL